MADTEIRCVFDIEPDQVGEAFLDAEAMAAYKAGRVVPHANVFEWLDSWGSPGDLPCTKP